MIENILQEETGILKAIVEMETIIRGEVIKMVHIMDEYMENPDMARDLIQGLLILRDMEWQMLEIQVLD